MRTMLRMLACATLVLTAAGARADEEKIAPDKLPKAVAEAVKAKFPKAEVTGATKEKDGDKTTFEVSVMDGKTKIDVNVSEAGAITGYEKSVALDDLPKAVAAAAAKEHPKGKAKNAEAVYTVKDGKDTLAFYEVFVEVDGKTVEVEILADGKLKPADKKKDEPKKDEPKKDKK